MNIYTNSNDSKRKKIKILGDCHGKFQELDALSLQDEYVIQLGDLGFDYEHIYKNYNPDKFKVILGNHDCYDNRPIEYDLGDYGPIEGLNDWFFVRGALSIDVLARVHTYMNGGPKTWWYEEELTNEELEDALIDYKNAKPRVMLTHDCPIIAKKWMRNNGSMMDLTRFGFTESDIDCRTQVYLQKMFDAHEPELWFLGHWHRSVDFKIGSTRFICLNELEYIDVDIDTLEII